MRQGFSHKMAIDSLGVITRRLDILTGLDQRQHYDCCINSCICYTCHFTDADCCSFCKEPQHDSNGHAHQIFSYIPLLLRFRAFFQNVEMIEKLQYRANFTPAKDGVSDVFDSLRYKELLVTIVEVDG